MTIITAEQVENACLKIAQRIKARTPEACTLAAVSRGGLAPTAIVAHYLGVKDILFIRLSSYADQSRQQSQISDTTTDNIPNLPNTYIIDDICDSGETVTYLRKKYPKAQIYTLVNKNSAIKPDYFPLAEEQGVWVNFPWEPEDRVSSFDVNPENMPE